jgi:Protein of unknown function (DUF3618)
MMDGNTTKTTSARDTALSQDVPRVAVYETTDTDVTVNDDVRVSETTPYNADTISDARTRYDATVEVKDDDRSPDNIEHDIEQTQERIADSIDELARRLSPTNIKDQAVQSLNESLNIPGLKYLMGDMKGNAGDNVRTMGMKVLEGVKHNALSSALLGVGVGLAAVGGIIAARTDTTRVTSRNYNTSKRNAKARTYDERLRGMMDTIENNKNSSEASSGLGEKLQHAKDAVGEKLQGAKEVVGETFQGVKETVSGGTGQVTDVARQGLTKAKEATLHGAQRSKESAVHLLEAQPLAIGAVALLAGAAVGLLLPRTHYEDSFMGEKSDQLISQAKGKAGEYVEAAKGTVNDVLQTAKDTAGEVVKTAKDTAKETVKAATA